MTLKAKLAGRFIVFDGPDGSGKGTQIRLLAEALEAQGLEVVCGTDPGGTEIGDRIRAVLLRHDLSKMDVRCEALLFMASRAQLAGEVIEPAIEAGKVVLCDRFISATCAYQGAAGHDIQQIIRMGYFAVGQTWPHLTLILDVPAEEGFRRIGRKPHHAEQRRKADQNQGLLLNDIRHDAMEARPIDYHRKVRKLFLDLPPEYPGRVEVIDAVQPPEQVHARVMELIERVDF
ncbi:MAG TPA: dTMP kinase [Phycisphaerae bacterium]|nr:dTMP kinase [Phycisphaerae bacterium]